MALLGKGAHLVGTAGVYGPSRMLAEKHLSRFGVESTWVDSTSLENVRLAMRPNTKMVYIESPSNPGMSVTDLAGAAAIAHEHGALLVVDNTFASPYFQRPLLLGADIVVHSTTKYIAGHSDIIGGAVVLNDSRLYNDLKYYQNAAGSVPGPWDSWLVLRGLKTLAVRMKAHEENALYLARYLSSHPKVERVHYPGLPSSKNYAVARRQMQGFSGMLSFELKGGRPAVDTFFSHLKLFALAESLGGVESLISYPAGMTHSSMPSKERLKRGIADNFIRVSVGIENKIDLKEDIAHALAFV